MALKAAETLAAEGISAEVIDPRTLVPLDERTILASAMKTSRAIVVDEGHQNFGVTAELAARIAEKAKAAGIDTVAFDRSGFRYHGRVKALADAAREAGLKF